MEKRHSLKINTIFGKSIHLIKELQNHSFYGEGYKTICNKHLKKANILTTISKKKKLCKLCFFIHKIKWVKK